MPRIKEKKEEKPWILEEKLQEMEKKENSYLDIIATFIREKGLVLENSKQLGLVIGRYGKVAKQMEGAFTNNQIYSAIERVKNDNAARVKKGQDEINWTLETVLKFLLK